jgi:hypothetical protein
MVVTAAAVQAHTMVGLLRLANTQYALQDVVASNVPGDFLEAGVRAGLGPVPLAVHPMPRKS